VARFEKTPIPDLSEKSIENAYDQAEWLLDSISSSLKYIQNGRTRFQKWAGSLRVVGLILSAGVTIALGIKWEQFSDELRNLAFVLGALATLLGSVDLYFNFRSLWIEHEEAKWRLNRLRDRINFYLSGVSKDSVDPVVISQFHDSYQWIWDNMSSNWLALRQNARLDKG